MSMNYCRHPSSPSPLPPLSLIRWGIHVATYYIIIKFFFCHTICTQLNNANNAPNLCTFINRVYSCCLSGCPDLHRSRRKSIIIRYPFACGWAYHCLFLNTIIIIIIIILSRNTGTACNRVATNGAAVMEVNLDEEEQVKKYYYCCKYFPSAPYRSMHGSSSHS